MDDPFQLSDQTSTMERLRQRTQELAALKGREPYQVTQEDYEAAKRDLEAHPQPWAPRRTQTASALTSAPNALGQGIAHAFVAG
jgi:hypothetical protein